ncbi:MAG: MarP family serine protease [Egibacteraceae bacterium]
MNQVDVILLLVLVYVGLRGFRQGALSQMASFGGAAVGLVGGAVWAPKLAKLFISRPGLDLAFLTLLVLFGIVMVCQGLGVALGLQLRAGAERFGVGGADRGAGIAVGLTGLVVIVWLLASVLMQGPIPSVAKALRQSQVVTTISHALPAPPNVFGRVSVYLNRQGFPQVFADVPEVTAPPVGLPADAAVNAAVYAGRSSTVQVEAEGCDRISSGSGFVTRPGFVVTNAHVVAGAESLTVRDLRGSHEAVAILVDPSLDLAVLSSPRARATAIDWVTTPAPRGTAGATLGFPGGQRDVNYRPAVVQAQFRAIGRDIYGDQTVTREILALSSGVQRGDSGGPFVTSDGQVGGVVFAASSSELGTGYALTAGQVSADVATAIARNRQVDTGPCQV